MQKRSQTRCVCVEGNKGIRCSVCTVICIVDAAAQWWQQWAAWQMQHALLLPRPAKRQRGMFRTSASASLKPGGRKDRKAGQQVVSLVSSAGRPAGSLPSLAAGRRDTSPGTQPHACMHATSLTTNWLDSCLRRRCVPAAHIRLGTVLFCRLTLLRRCLRVPPAAACLERHCSSPVLLTS